MQAKNNPARIEPAPIIPPDFDPFGPPPEPSPHPIDTPSIPESQDILGLGLGSSLPDQSIDELFGLRQGKDADLFSSGSPSSLIPAPDQSGKASVDPLVALGAAAEHKPSPAQAQRDDVPELQGSFRPPEAKPDLAMRAVLPEKPHTPAAPSPEPYGMVLSWESKEPDRGIGEITSVIVPSPGHERRKAERRRREQPRAISLEPVSEKVAQPEERVSQTGSTASPALPPTPSSRSISGADALLDAFLNGAGVPDLAIANGLTPQFMNTLGQLLRESTQGTLDLLLARTLTKREVRAELTMIAPRENNPLKFSPTVEAALAHLLAPQGRGFMTPLQAMKDAHDDLRAHQFGFMAGMRAALAGVLDRFDPEELERRLTQKTVIDTLLPINRKAKLWDLFAERYKEISHEAEEDFHALFGKEFLRAYEAQIAKLDQDGK
jgi:FHA domain-containing protein